MLVEIPEHLMKGPYTSSSEEFWRELRSWNSHPQSTFEGQFFKWLEDVVEENVEAENVDEEDIYDTAHATGFEEGREDMRIDMEREVEDAKQEAEQAKLDHHENCVPAYVHSDDMARERMRYDTLLTENQGLHAKLNEKSNALAELQGRVNALERLVAPVKRNVSIRRKNGEGYLSNGVEQSASET